MLVLVAASFATTQFAPTDRPDPELNQIAAHVASAAQAKYASPALAPDQIGITLMRVDRTRKSVTYGAYRGDDPMYPASVVKMFYIAYAQQLLEDRKLKLTAELDRAMHDMIVDSNNDATGQVLDCITDTTGGPELSPRALRAWMARRQAVNRYFASLGYPKLNACQKTWNEGPYGRERQGYGDKYELRNSLSPNVCARLMADIALARIVTPARCDAIRKLMTRGISAEGPADSQSRTFTGDALPKGFRLESKAGFTSEVRHDVAHITAPDGREFILVIFTKGHSEDETMIPTIATYLLRDLKLLP